jgi:inosine/xanthosine triphosphatase
VGSANPAKRASAERAVSRVWPEARVVTVDVPSGVADQPRSDAEAVEGASNRARSALESTGADVGIGLEGNTCEIEGRMFLSGWAVALDREGRRGIGCGGALLLPERIAAEIRAGRELGPVMDEVTGEEDTRSRGGAVGALTQGLVERAEAFERAVLFALAPFLRPDLYAGGR